MKISRLQTRHLLIPFLLLILTSANSQAQRTDNFLSQLHNFRVSNYVSLDAYYRFIGSGSTDTVNEIVAGLDKANASLKLLLTNNTKVPTREQVEALTDEFGKYKNLMSLNINDVQIIGYPDLRLVSDMASQAAIIDDMATQLYHTALENSGTAPNPGVDAARQAAIKIAQMSAKYSVRTNSSVAQTFQGSSTETPLDQQARELDQLLETVANGKSNNELNALIEGVTGKWKFIRGSYINYNENNVGFVINRYSKQILSGLTEAITMLQETAG